MKVKQGDHSGPYWGNGLLFDITGDLTIVASDEPAPIQITPVKRLAASSSSV
jgi:hypothetical protein